MRQQVQIPACLFRAPLPPVMYSIQVSSFSLLWVRTAVGLVEDVAHSLDHSNSQIETHSCWRCEVVCVTLLTRLWCKHCESTLLPQNSMRHNLNISVELATLHVAAQIRVSGTNVLDPPPLPPTPARSTQGPTNVYYSTFPLVRRTVNQTHPSCYTTSHHHLNTEKLLPLMVCLTREGGREGKTKRGVEESRARSEEVLLS